MTAKQPEEAPAQSDELELSKKTLKDLPESGEDAKGGLRPKATTALTTVLCTR